MEKSDNDVKTPIFSEAELKVTKLLVRGLSEKEIANRLNLSRHTVNNHMRNIREKNGVSKNLEIVLLYIAYIKHKKFSLKTIREVGISSIMVLVNVCEYTQM